MTLSLLAHCHCPRSICLSNVWKTTTHILSVYPCFSTCVFKKPPPAAMFPPTHTSHPILQHNCRGKTGSSLINVAIIEQSHHMMVALFGSRPQSHIKNSLGLLSPSSFSTPALPHIPQYHLISGIQNTLLVHEITLALAGIFCECFPFCLFNKPPPAACFLPRIPSECGPHKYTNTTVGETRVGY